MPDPSGTIHLLSVYLRFSICSKMSTVDQPFSTEAVKDTASFKLESVPSLQHIKHNDHIQQSQQRQYLQSGSDKRYICPHCHQIFVRKHNLKSHLLVHANFEDSSVDSANVATTDKPEYKKFVCQVCLSKFKRIHDLKRHLKLHSGEKPFFCKNCGRKFARNDALLRHSKALVGCAVKFTQNHLKIQYLNEDSQPDNDTTSKETKAENPSNTTSGTVPNTNTNSGTGSTFTLFTTMSSSNIKRNSISDLLNDTTPFPPSPITRKDSSVTQQQQMLPPIKTSIPSPVLQTPTPIPQSQPRGPTPPSDAQLAQEQHISSEKQSQLASRGPRPQLQNSQPLPQQSQKQHQPQQEMLLLKILESRVKALEERLHSTESRVSFLESQLAPSGHY